MTTVDRVLTLLLAEDSLSGEDAARTLGVSRNAVWKAIAEIRARGYTVEAASGRGYRLTGIGQDLSAPVIRRFLTAGNRAFDFTIRDTVTSTNSVARQLSEEGAKEFTVVLADRQTEGRGRRGRTFYSEGAHNIYMSLILRPTLPPDRAIWITAAAPVSAVRALKKVAGIDASIKWVNDIFVFGKKVAGILTEGALDMESGTLSYAVMGIGINIGRTDFPPEIADVAGSLEALTKKPIARAAVIGAFLSEFYRIYTALPALDFMEEYRRRSLAIGRTVTVADPGGAYPATVTDVTNDGTLVIKKENGETAVLVSGEISIKL